MDNSIVQIIFLSAGLLGWIFSSFPVLRYVIHWSEGSYRWQLIPWLLLMVICIFVLKMSLFSLAGWPVPGSWSSRLFFPLMMFSSYLLPFIKEYVLHLIKSR